MKDPRTCLVVLRVTYDRASMDAPGAWNWTNLVAEPEDFDVRHLRGLPALAYAERYGVPLSKYEDPLEPYLESITLDEGRAIAREDPSLLHCDTLPCSPATVEVVISEQIDTSPETAP